VIIFQSTACNHKNVLSDEKQLYKTSSVSNIRGAEVVRSFIQTADGYANVTKGKTDFEARQDAVKDAEKILSESVKKYIGSEPDIKILGQTDYHIEDNNRYHIQIKAEITYKPGAEDIRNIDQNAPLTVMSNRIPKTVYKDGENIEIRFKGNRDHYVQIIHINPNGDILRLLPEKSSFKSGEDYKSDFKIKEPYGSNCIIVYANSSPIDEKQIINELNQNKKLPGSLTDRLRGVEVTAVSSSTEFIETFEFITEK